MYDRKKIKPIQISKLFTVADILYRCGKEMAEKYDLHHWDNSRLKTLIVVALCAMKNQIYLVYDENHAPVATFQIRKTSRGLLFQKLATFPAYTGKGIGSYCMKEIEHMAKNLNADMVYMDVYSQSEHAISFYKHRGYTVYGKTQTLKYTELKMKKDIEK